LGIEHREDWIGYHRGDSLFLKSIEFRENTIYPDGGCNFETFTNEEMLEVEALGPLVTLTRGAAATHTERWHLLANVDPPPRADEEISAWIAPLLSRAAIDAQRISQKA
jgi:hypothetical protein